MSMSINVDEKLMAKILADAKGSENSDKDAAQCIALMSMIAPCLKRNSKLKYETSWGDKSEIGLFRTLRRFFIDNPS